MFVLPFDRPPGAAHRVVPPRVPLRSDHGIRCRPRLLHSPPIDTALEILTVCTGNLHRSPLAAALLQRDLDARRLPAHVTSAGVVSDGLPCGDEIRVLLDARGLDVSGHRTRTLSTDLLGEQDLVVALAREHAREVLTLRPDLLPRTFTLKELVRRGAAVGPRPSGTPLDDWLAEVGAGRLPTGFLGASAADDVADPNGRRFGVFKKTANEIEGLTAQLAVLLAGR